MTEPLHLFEGIGVEIEYAIVDTQTLDVRPVADLVLSDATGQGVTDVDRGAIAWSNELALHVIELKTNGPVRELSTLPALLQDSLSEVSARLTGPGARLMPGGAHPWMDPDAESRLWPHEYNDVYRAYDRIFGCSGHGWTNLQSVHINLPFHGDEEFRRLHAAIRLVLPLLPAIAASSPVLDGRVQTALDGRLVAYANNSARVPSVAGRVVPEPVGTAAEYQRDILERIYTDLAPLDPEGTLRHEWANARGAIARFDRGAIEIRVLDSQECATADVALVAAVVDVVEWAVREVGPDAADAVSTGELAGILDRVVERGERASLDSKAYANALGLAREDTTARDAWGLLVERAANRMAEARFTAWIETVLEHGPLARRLLAALGPSPSRDRLGQTYGELCDCLVMDTLFH